LSFSRSLPPKASALFVNEKLKTEGTTEQSSWKERGSVSLSFSTGRIYCPMDICLSKPKKKGSWAPERDGEAIGMVYSENQDSKST
jgi:hypothetical protein